MKILIIEDEKPAAEHLERLLLKQAPHFQIVAKLESVKQAVEWLKVPPTDYDLIFMDIKLADGLSFEIFKHVSVFKPIIFTTAYNEYAVDAFRVNSVDYILKPINQEDLQQSLNKLKSLQNSLSKTADQYSVETINKVLSSLQKQYKTRFMVKVGDHLRSVSTEKIAYFYAEGRHVYLVNWQDRKFIIDYKMEDLAELLDPAVFFRVNRSFILNIESITDVIIFSNSRLRIGTKPETEKEILVSREKVNVFKDWFNGI